MYSFRACLHSPHLQENCVYPVIVPCISCSHPGFNYAPPNRRWRSESTGHHPVKDPNHGCSLCKATLYGNPFCGRGPKSLGFPIRISRRCPPSWVPASLNLTRIEHGQPYTQHRSNRPDSSSPSHEHPPDVGCSSLSSFSFCQRSIYSMLNGNHCTGIYGCCIHPEFHATALLSDWDYLL